MLVFVTKASDDYWYDFKEVNTLDDLMEKRTIFTLVILIFGKVLKKKIFLELFPQNIMLQFMMIISSEKFKISHFFLLTGGRPLWYNKGLSICDGARSQIRADFTTKPTQCQIFFHKILHKFFPPNPEIIVQIAN